MSSAASRIGDPIEVVILAGGLGTRLRPFTISIPKPLLPLADKPIAQIVLEQLKIAGFRNVCFSLGYLAPLFQAFFGDGSRFDLNITYVLENSPLGTAGALYLVPNLADDFLVLNGDTLTDLRYQSLLEFHKKTSATATVFSQKIDDYVDYGIVEFNSDGQLKTYTEKPTRHYHVSTGIYALSRQVLDFIPAGQRFDMPDLLRKVQSSGRSVLCYQQEGAYWRDIGRFDHYEAASKDFVETPTRFLSTKEA